VTFRGGRQPAPAQPQHSHLKKLARRAVAYAHHQWASQTGGRVRYVPLGQLRPEFAGARRVLR